MPNATPTRDVVAAHHAKQTRKEIQALRAFAVIAVVLYHMWPLRMTGGYTGVDIFFVISGFLITAHLLREVEKSGRISLSQFWARRARRLLPASLAVVVVSAVSTLIFVPQSYWQQFFREFGASSIYVLNWVLASDAVDYLASTNQPSPVQHYWSLSAEEQFYILWPLLILFGVTIARHLAKVGRYRSILLVLATAVAASFVASVVLTNNDPASAYFVTTTRAWEFGIGGILSFMADSRSTVTRDHGEVGLRTAASWAGLATLVGVVFFYTESTPFPGWTAAIPALATALVIWAGTQQGKFSAAWLISPRPIQWFGDISYSLYLWHWPPIVIVPFVTGHSLTWLEKILVLGTAILLAWLTKLFVEDPIRTTAFFTLRRPRRTFLWMTASMAIVVGASGIAWVVLEARTTQSVQTTAALVEAGTPCFGAAAVDPRNQPCDNASLHGKLFPDRAAGQTDGVIDKSLGCRVSKRDPQVKLCNFVKGATKVALVGDSHAEQWLPALRIYAEAHNWRLDTYLKGGCPFSDVMRSNDATDGNGTCQTWNDEVKNRLIAGGYQIIITSQLTGVDFVHLAGETSFEAATRGLITRWTSLESKGIRVIAIRDNPTPIVRVPSCLSALGNDAVDRARECGAPESSSLHPDPQVGAALKSGADLIDLTAYFCQNDFCPAITGSVIIYRDDSHLGGTYSRTLEPFLGERLDSLLNLNSK
ncbi:MAG: acyltransferase [Cryobacterium sp.]|nr:acyltransferase [Cryobacterium sp.]